MEMRADARRNREAITDAALAVFAEQGLDAALDEIAKRAEVGNATLYRHFADRCALIEAVFAGQMEEYAAASRLAAVDEDAWRGFVSFVTFACRAQAANLGLSELLTSKLFDASARIVALRAETRGNVQATIGRLRAEGAVPANFAHQDVVLILMGNAGVVRATRAHAPAAWERHLAFVLAGIGPERSAPAQLPEPPSVAEVEASMRASESAR
jgi:AcrR family transcriptional regulator